MVGSKIYETTSGEKASSNRTMARPRAAIYTELEHICLPNKGRFPNFPLQNQRESSNISLYGTTSNKFSMEPARAHGRWVITFP